MSGINTQPNIADVDGFYAELIAAHEGLTKEESDALNARLILTLANHVGERAVLSEAISLAKQSDA
ncbi:MAG: DUF2783 domain-containing protein [Geminicoccaceae bacterium]